MARDRWARARHASVLGRQRAYGGKRGAVRVDALRMHMKANALFASVGEPGGTGYAPSRASLSAFGLGDYSEALRLARAGYNAFAESNHRWGLIVALCRIGFAALALGDLADARERFGSAFARAGAAQSVTSSCLRPTPSPPARPSIGSQRSCRPTSSQRPARWPQ